MPLEVPQSFITEMTSGKITPEIKASLTKIPTVAKDINASLQKMPKPATAAKTSAPVATIAQTILAPGAPHPYIGASTIANKSLA
jgi:hypothetical protein